jgi:hypothetical protein
MSAATHFRRTLLTRLEQHVQACWKEGYSSSAQAHRAARKKKLLVYRCCFCDRYHLTSQQQRSAGGGRK